MGHINQAAEQYYQSIRWLHEQAKANKIHRLILIEVSNTYADDVMTLLEAAWSWGAAHSSLV